MIVKKNKDEIQDYLSDASNTKGFCDAVCFPQNVDEVIELFKEANNKKFPVTIAGNRTGLTGAAVPNGGIVVSTEKLNRIIEIGRTEKFAILQPGVLLSEFQNELKNHKLFYPPDPTETNCFIGGTVATNASGAKTFKYGSTRNYVLELEVVLPTGDLITINRGKIFAADYLLKLESLNNKKYNLVLPKINLPVIKNAAGYYCKAGMDAIDLFIGSEGTLGFISKIKLKLLDEPAQIISSVQFFKSEEEALRFVQLARDATYANRKKEDKISIDALALEYFDERALKFLQEDFKRIPADAKAAVWFEQIVNDNRDKLIEDWIELFTRCNGDPDKAWFALNEKERKNLIDFRHRISEKVNEYISANNFRKLGTDIAVPDNNFRKFYYSSKKQIKDAKLDFVIYGHIGNSHLHINLLPKNNDEFEKAQQIYKNICMLAIKEGGTFSAEHGVGKNKTELLIEMYGIENIEMMKKIKKTLDPNWILGRGNIFKI